MPVRMNTLQSSRSNSQKQILFCFDVQEESWKLDELVVKLVSLTDADDERQMLAPCVC